MTGSVLLEMLEHSVTRIEPGNIEGAGSFLQFSGLTVVYDIKG